MAVWTQTLAKRTWTFLKRIQGESSLSLSKLFRNRLTFTHPSFSFVLSSPGQHFVTTFRLWTLCARRRNQNEFAISLFTLWGMTNEHWLYLRCLSTSPDISPSSKIHSINCKRYFTMCPVKKQNPQFPSPYAVRVWHNPVLAPVALPLDILKNWHITKTRTLPLFLRYFFFVQYFSIRFEKRSSWTCWTRTPNVMFISAQLGASLRHQFALLENNFQNFNLTREALGEKLSLLFSSCLNFFDSLLSSHDSWSWESATYVTLCSPTRRSYVCNLEHR